MQLELTDTVIDLLESGADMAIRFGSRADSSLIARPLAPNYRMLCAAPAYLKKHGVPKHPDELVGHRCIIMRDQPWADWHFESDEPITVRVFGPLFSNDGSAAHSWALDGAGIVLKSIWDVGDDIAASRLRRVLPKYRISSAPLHAIYPHSRHLAPRVRAFIEYLGERLREAWRWDEG